MSVGKMHARSCDFVSSVAWWPLLFVTGSLLLLLLTSNIVFTQSGALCGGAGQQASTVFKTCLQIFRDTYEPQEPLFSKAHSPVPYTLQSPRVGPLVSSLSFPSRSACEGWFQAGGFSVLLEPAPVSEKLAVVSRFHNKLKFS